MKLADAKIGVKVKVVRAADECANDTLIGKIGTITQTQRFGAGVGESRRDPFITVEFQPEAGAPRQDGFWLEELEIVK